MMGTEVKTASYEELAEQAGIEAEFDGVASPGREAQPEDVDSSDKEDNNQFIVEFFREYEFDNGQEVTKYKTIDLSGLLDLTTVDGERFDRILMKLGHYPPNKLADLTYCKHVAKHVTGLPVEFFNMLDIRDMMLVAGTVRNFFLYG